MAVTFPFLPQCPEIDAADNLVCIYTVIDRCPSRALITRYSYLTHKEVTQLVTRIGTEFDVQWP